MNKTKKIILIIISASIFLAIYGLSLFFFTKIGLVYRKSSYYAENIFSLYKNEEYEKYHLNYLNIDGYYSKKENLYDFKKLDKNELNYHFAIKQIKNKKTGENGYSIVFYMLKFYAKNLSNHEKPVEVLDLMSPRDVILNEKNYKFRDYVSFSFSYSKTYPKNKNTSDYTRSIFPFNYFRFRESGFLNNSYLNGIKLVFNDSDSPRKINGINYYRKTYLIASDGTSTFETEEAIDKKSDIDLRYENYKLSDKKRLSSDDIKKLNLFSENYNYKGHNKVLASSLIIVNLIFLILAYFIFVNKKLVEYIKIRRKMKKNMNDSNNLDEEKEKVLEPENDIQQDL